MAARPSESDIRQFQLSSFDGGGWNKMWRAKGPGGTDWLIKICRNTRERTPEICERELWISLLGKVVGIPVVDAWVVCTNLFEDLDLSDSDESSRGKLIRDKCVLMPLLKGETVQKKREAAASCIGRKPEAAADIFAFMRWVGDEDRGLCDVMLVDGELVLIDNGLCGPGDDALLRGYHPTPEAYQNNNNWRVKMCNCSGKRSLVSFVLRDLELPHRLFATPPALERIIRLSDDAVYRTAEEAGIKRDYAKILVDRKQAAYRDYDEWFGEASNLCKWW